MARSAAGNWPRDFGASDFEVKTPKVAVRFELEITTITNMRTILFSFIAAILVLGAFSSCSTSVRTDSGHGVTAGVH